MKKISVLGCGWLGLPLAKQLTTTYQVSGSIRKTSILESLKYEYFKPYLIDIAAGENSNFKEFLSSDILIMTIPPRHENHVTDMQNMITQVEQSSIQHVIYCSSISVYGKQTGLVNEDTSTAPITDNAKKIVAIENALLQNTHFKSTVIRLGGLIGGERHPAKYLSNRKIKQPQAPINLVHLDDVIGSINNILKDELIGVFDVVTPHHPTKAEYYTTVCKQLKLTPPIISNEDDRTSKIINSEKLQKHYTFINSRLSYTE